MPTKELTLSRVVSLPTADEKFFFEPKTKKRFRHFIEHSDWEQSLFTHERWMNRLSVALIIFAFFYFVPHILVMLSDFF